MANELFKSSDPEGMTDPDQVNVEAVKGKFVKEDGTVDIDALLIKAAHADKHIAKIEGENLNLRTEVDKRINYQDLLDKITAQREVASNQVSTETGQRTNDQVAVTEDAIEKLIESKLTIRQNEALRAANEQHVVKELRKTWGDNYISKLRSRVQELDMTEDEAIQLSQVKPKAFLALVTPQVSVPVDNSYAPPRTLQTTPMSGSTNKNYAYFRDQLKKNPKLEHDHRFTNEMHAQAAKLGEAFYS